MSFNANGNTDADEFIYSIREKEIPDVKVKHLMEMYNDITKKASNLLDELNYDGPDIFDEENKMDFIRYFIECFRCDCNRWCLQENVIKCQVCKWRSCPSCWDGKKSINKVSNNNIMCKDCDN